MTTLRETLTEITQRARWRFHFPSHAGRPISDWLNQPHNQETLFAWDTTELPELDVLGNPTGLLAETQAKVAEQYKTQQSFFLINGASVGLMATLLALPQDKKVLIARNAHRSVIQGLILSGHEPVWILPEEDPYWGIWGGLTIEAVVEALEQNEGIVTLVLTHPTYEGIDSSELPEIISYCHARGIAVIVDEAHGALWPLFDELPQSALDSGADIVVHSLHKSAGAFTQNALCHVSHNSLIPSQAIQETLNLLQTSSPSYVLLENIESTLSFWDSKEGKGYFTQHFSRCQALVTWINEHCKNIQCHPTAANRFQLLLQHEYLSSEALATELEETYDIAFESVNERSVLLHLNFGLPDDAFSALKLALEAIEPLKQADNIHPHQFVIPFQLPEIAMTPREAFFRPSTSIQATDAVGRISQQLIAACPPGIPVLIPGEVVQAHHLQYCPEEIQIVSE